LPIKQNLAPTACGLAYRITQTAGAPAAHIHWELETPVPTTEEAFARPKQPPTPSPERLAARIWLKQILADGPRPARLVLREGESHGFLPRTLQRAFHEFGGHTAKRGLLQGWWWSLAEESQEPADTDAAPASPADTPTKTADFFEGVTFAEDVAEQRALDELLTINDREVALARIAVERECAQLRTAPIRPPQWPSHDKIPSKTGHQLLDQILTAVENSIGSRPIVKRAESARAAQSAGAVQTVGGVSDADIAPPRNTANPGPRNRSQRPLPQNLCAPP
jgi:hypothetical protein